VILTLDPKHEGAQKGLAELYSSRQRTPSRVGPAPVPAPTAPLEAGAMAQANEPPAPAPAAAAPSAEIEIEVEEIPFQPEAPPPPKESLPAIPLFSSLTSAEFLAVLNGAMEAKAFRVGEAIVNEGAPGDAMYAIAQGSVAVLRNTHKVATMGEGEFFGEMALLSGAPRLATVVAETDTVVLAFPRAEMDATIAKHPGVKAALEQFYRERLLLNLMRANPLLQPLSDARRAALSAAFQSCTFKKNDIILEEGRDGVAVFLLLRGRCAVFHRDTTKGSYPDLTEGDAFGEISVACETPVSATVMAKEPVVALRVPAEAFREIVLGNADVKKQVLLLASQRLTRTAKQGLLADQGDQRV
jgi:cAMP-dependent protein kinase regulator